MCTISQCKDQEVGALTRNLWKQGDPSGRNKQANASAKRHKNNFYMKEDMDHRSYRRNVCSCEKKAWKNSGLYRIRTLDLCDTGAALLPNELRSPLGAGRWIASLWTSELPVKGWWRSYEYKKIIYENCGVKNYMKEDHPQFTFSASSTATAIHFKIQYRTTLLPYFN